MASKTKFEAQEAAAHISAYSDKSITPLPFKMISADSHVSEPPTAYIDNIDPKFRDRAPHVVKNAEGGDVYLVDGLPTQIRVGQISCAGLDPRNVPVAMNAATYEDVYPGTYDAKARIADQDRDGVGAEIIYPSIGMLVCNHPEPDYRKACMDAYNRWLLEFQSAAPDRIYGAAQTPVRSVKEAVDDLRRMKEQGFRGVMMPGDPCTDYDYDDPAFDELWEAASDLELPLGFHILTSKKDTKAFAGKPTFRGTAMANYDHGILRGNQDLIAMFIWARIFERFPKLKLVCVEADAGWAPHFMYRMDHFYNRHRFWSKTEDMAMLPSDYFRENIYLTFQDDFIALNMTEFMNPKRLLWANDYPHIDSTWPWSQQYVHKQTAHLSEDLKRAILRDNVAELYKIPVQ